MLGNLFVILFRLINSPIYFLAMKEPKFRCVTYNAIQILVREFGYPYDENMQDWEYEVAKLEDIKKYFEKYDKAENDDIRFTLMEMIIETSNEGWNSGWLTEIWPKVKQMLIENFTLHEYTIYYWCYSLSDNIEDMFEISPYMRNLWKEQTGNNYEGVYT